MQEKEDAWTDEGVFRIKGEIPLAYRVGGTSLVAAALREAAPDDEAARHAVGRALDEVLRHPGDPLLEPSTEGAYDVRLWAQAAALELLARVPRRTRDRHRYAAQAVQMLPKPARAEEQERLRELLLRTKDPDGTWNDRVFDRSKSYGTAMPLVVLLGDHAALPPRFDR